MRAAERERVAFFVLDYRHEIYALLAFGHYFCLVARVVSFLLVVRSHASG